jgi:transposase
MPFPRKRSALQFTEQEEQKLESIRRSRTEEKRRTLRAAILLDSRSGLSDETIARHNHVSRGTVLLCIQKCLEFGLDAALGELPRPGKPRRLPDDAITWVQNLACQKPKELGYSYELWTYRLLTHPHSPALRRSWASGAAEGKPLQAPQDPASR